MLGVPADLQCALRVKKTKIILFCTSETVEKGECEFECTFFSILKARQDLCALHEGSDTEKERL